MKHGDAIPGTKSAIAAASTPGEWDSFKKDTLPVSPTTISLCKNSANGKDFVCKAVHTCRLFVVDVE